MPNFESAYFRAGRVGSSITCPPCGNQQELDTNSAYIFAPIEHISLTELFGSTHADVRQNWTCNSCSQEAWREPVNRQEEVVADCPIAPISGEFIEFGYIYQPHTGKVTFKAKSKHLEDLFKRQGNNRKVTHGGKEYWYIPDSLNSGIVDSINLGINTAGYKNYGDWNLGHILRLPGLSEGIEVEYPCSNPNELDLLGPLFAKLMKAIYSKYLKTKEYRVTMSIVDCQ